MTDPTPKPFPEPPPVHPPEAAQPAAPADPATPAPQPRKAGPQPGPAAEMPKPPLPAELAASRLPIPEPPRAAARSAPEYPPPPPSQPPRGRSAVPVLSALGFLLLLAGLFWLWSQVQDADQRLTELAQQQATLPPPPAIDPARIAGLDDQVKALQGQIGTLQQKVATPAPPPDLAPLEARLAALEGRKPPPPVDVAASTAPLQARIETLAASSAPVQSRLDGLAADIATLKAAQDAEAKRVSDLGEQLKAAQQQQAALADRATQLQQVAHAEVALAAGQPLGAMQAASPALSRFATENPPTEAALRLSFPPAAAAAIKASQPSTEGQPVLQRMWLRARQLLTVKQGERVLVGAPATTVIGNAQQKLDVGDLAGAVTALDGLDPAAARAMAGWRGQAQALLDARAALAQMARS